MKIYILINVRYENKTDCIIIYNDEIIEKWKRQTLRLCELSSEVIVEK